MRFVGGIGGDSGVSNTRSVLGTTFVSAAKIEDGGSLPLDNVFVEVITLLSMLIAFA